jgi:hypothetical protein
MSDEKLEDHTLALLGGRIKQLEDALSAAIVESGAENLDHAHGEVCFHFDDGMIFQIDFSCGRKSPDVEHTNPEVSPDPGDTT